MVLFLFFIHFRHDEVYEAWIEAGCVPIRGKHHQVHFFFLVFSVSIFAEIIRLFFFESLGGI